MMATVGRVIGMPGIAAGKGLPRVQAGTEGNATSAAAEGGAAGLAAAEGEGIAPTENEVVAAAEGEGIAATENEVVTEGGAAEDGAVDPEAGGGAAAVTSAPYLPINLANF